MIVFEKVTKIYPPQSIAVEDISFGIESGEFISLVGKSGAGKTTILRLLLSEEKPTGGDILFKDLKISNIASHHLSEFRRKIGMVFQDYKLLPTKTAKENISYVLEVMGVDEGEIERDVDEVLNIVGLKERGRHFPHELSGGEKQRVAIARALIHRPEIIIADEPTGNLDPYPTRDIMKLLIKINELGTTVILATHNKEIINKLGKRVLTLDSGKLIRDEQKGKFIL